MSEVQNICKRYNSFLEALPPSTLEKLPELGVDNRLSPGSMDVSTDEIISREAHEREKEHIWTKAWQMACREEQIPEIGDQYVYDICDKSYIVVRSAENEFRAFVNSCPHRGRQLREYNGNAAQIRCGFHALTWSLEGEIKHLPCLNEFTRRGKDDWRLPQIKTGTWGGFVFINPDPEAESLESYLGELPEHFKRWKLEDRYIVAHVQKICPTNWKVAQEAFMESFHVTTTHPQATLVQNNLDVKGDVFGNFSRQMSLLATPSPQKRGDVSNQEVVDAALNLLPEEEKLLEVPDGVPAREFMAEAQRERLRVTLGDQVDELEQTELVDIFYYTVFPNFHPWGAFNELTYRFRPNGDDHRTSIMEVYYLQTFKEGERPAPNPTTHLSIDQWFSEAPELGNLAWVFDQDVLNFPAMQRGLESSATGKIVLTEYQEIKIRHFYELYRKWLGYDAAAAGAASRPRLVAG
ncbi:aromatic ring-hydroxylating oxygenase subunit alpha [Parasphingopyxis marina]|uniref:Aromatic ring-hydroxylating dioxygenase subunit alpha n=1 Tax=Parasphingopyxis marina TaxID=2761622 RepID=A0A842HW96_9SPHN|nr:aromatic ring-hydroxylating dioxygenase subunit alpha [Parasphingopyxis marina]MBC2776631.1 aromatic ring-hydroxylating dioxygenase subunit alpha [Parasphingopyxis marina]